MIDSALDALKPSVKRPLTTHFVDCELIYVQHSGSLYLGDNQNGFALVGRGYSGKGSSTNDPGAERIIATGPIPRGMWAIRPAIRHGRLGPVSLPLSPWKHDAHGRSGFYIHGDNRNANFTASSGCIILNRYLREWIELMRANGLNYLRVVECSPFEIDGV